MSDTLPTEKTIDLVQEQGEMLLGALAQIAAGQVDLEIEIPEGIEVMSDLAVAISFLAEDVANRIKTQNKLLEEMEMRIQERTHELENVVFALEESQNKYLRGEWASFSQSPNNEFGTSEWLQSNKFQPAVEKTITEKIPAIMPVNGNNAAALTVPINLADNLIGMLGFEGEDLEAISDEDLSAIEDIAEQVGLALENQRLFNQTQDALAETEALYLLSSDLNEAESTDDIVTAFVNTFSHYKADDVKLWTIKSDNNEILSMKIDSLWVSDSNPNLFPLGSDFDLTNFPFFIDLFQNIREVTYVSSISEDPRTSVDTNFVQIMERIDLKSMIFMPLFIGSRLVGLFTIGWMNNPQFSEKDSQFFTTIASQIATVVDSLRLLDQTQDALAETQTLYQISAQLNAAESIQDLILSVVETTSNSNVDTARFWVAETLSDGSNWLEIAGNWSKESNDPYDIGYRFEYSENPFLVKILQENRKTILISSIKDDVRTKDDTELLARIEPTGLNSFIYLPLLIGQRLIGLFVMSWKEIQSFDQSDTLRFTAIGAQIATAYDSLRSLDQTRSALAETQSLYEISARLNAAESTFDIVSSIKETLTDYDIDEIILWQVGPNLSGGGLQITMTEAMPETQNINPKDEFFSYKLSDYPFLKGLLTDSRTVTFVSSIEDDPLTSADKNYLKLMHDVGLKSMIYLPLLIGARLVGLVTLGWRTHQSFKESESQRFTAISSQIATANDGLRLLDQTQQALSETQALYQISARLNAAESPDEIVKAVVDTISGQELDGARLWIAHDTEDDGLLIENVSSWFKDQDQNTLGTGAKIPINSERLPYLYELLNHSKEVRLISAIQEALEDVDPDFLEALKPSGYTSMAFLPLSVGSKVRGLFTFGWNVVKPFDPLEQQYFTAIGAQIATTVEGLRLLEDTKLRAAQLEQLTEVEAALSAANSEDEILYTIGNAFSFARGGLHYIDQDSSGLPDIVKTVAIYENKQLVPAEDLPQRFGDVNRFLAGEVWLEKPNSITMISNTAEFDGLNEHSREIATNMNSVGFCVVPLHSGRSWQGVLTLSWPVPHKLTPTEDFLLENLREPLSAIVARHRSQMAAQKARQESEQLYDASRQLNEASSDLNKIVEVVTKIVLPMGYDKTVLSFVRKDRNDKAIGIEVAAIYQADGSPNYLEIGQRFGRASYERAAKYKSPFFIEDVSEEKELSAISKDLLEKLQSNSVGLIPLSVGSLEIGYLFLLSSSTNKVSEGNQNLLNSLSPQIAVAVQNSLLFDASQKRADREYLLREISEKVRNTSDVESVMRTAVTEIGRVLGRKTFLYLKSGDDDTKPNTDR